MNQILTPDQICDLAAIRKICDEMAADVVVIGATALLLSIGDIGRFTRDVDLTVALDLNEFSQLIQRLLATGWKQSSKLEHRWVAPRQTIVDLLPAGPALRRSGSVLWPTSQFRMSLSGFDHVFASAIDVDLSANTRIRVAPVSVTALLKMIAYMEDPHRRSKDLQDIEIILGRYASGSDRLFSDEVFDAELPDFNMTNAFLLGLDLRSLATNEEAKYVERFLDRFAAGEERLGEQDFKMRISQRQIRALQTGFKGR
jgi:predicted nucleotidyltransferase